MKGQGHQTEKGSARALNKLLAPKRQLTGKYTLGALMVEADPASRGELNTLTGRRIAIGTEIDF